MRDEWIQQNNFASDSRSSQGLTRQQGGSGGSGRLGEPGGSRLDKRSGLDRSASLTMAHKAMKLKFKGSTGGGEGRKREVSERRQVGDAESVNQPSSVDDAGKSPWWRHVDMGEGL